METELLSRPGSAAGAADVGPADPEALIRRHQGMVWRYLRLLGADAGEADDMMQDTFLKVLSQPLVEHSPAATAALLRKMAHHVFLDARRRQGRRSSVLLFADAVEHLVAREPGSLDDERIEALRHCLARVGARSRRALELRHSQGLGTHEVAHQLGLTLNGLKSLLRRVRQGLRDCVRQALGPHQRDGNEVTREGQQATGHEATQEEQDR